MAKEIVDNLFPGDDEDLSQVPESDLIVAGSRGSLAHEAEYIRRGLLKKIAERKNK